MAVLYGVLSEQDLANNRVTTVGVDLVMTAVQRSVAEHDRQLRALMGLFVRPTTKWQTKFASAVAARLQPLDSSGRARPIKPAARYTVGLPIQAGGAAWGTDYVTSIKMTVGDVAEITAMMQDADMRWMRDHLLAALFYENGTSAWTFPDPANGDLSVYGLANGDSITYNILSGADAEATDDHVLGYASLTATVFSDIYAELTEHPTNAGEVVVFIPTASKATVEGLTGFYPIADPNLRVGTGSTTLIGSLGVAMPGTVIGYIEGCWVVEWSSLPSNYVIGVTTGGEKPIAMREDEEAELQGFKKVAERNDYPWYESQWLRRAGFGAWNRVGAVVARTNNSTYAIPTGYSSPMP